MSQAEIVNRINNRTKPNKNISLISKEAFSAWNEVILAFDSDFEVFFNDFESKVLFAIEAGFLQMQNNSLKSTVIQEYKDIISSYGQIVSNIKENSGGMMNKNLKLIIEGIAGVLKIRLRHYLEIPKADFFLQSQQAANDFKDSVVLADLLSSLLSEPKKALIVLIRKEIMLKLEFSPEIKTLAAEMLTDAIFGGDVQNLYKIILNTRKHSLKFDIFGLFKEELDTLNSVITYQCAAAEHEMCKIEEQFNLAETVFVSKAIAKIKKLSQNGNEIIKSLNLPNETNMFERIISIISNSFELTEVDFLGMKNSIKEKYAAFNNTICREFTAFEFNKFKFSYVYKEIYECTKIISECKAMTREIIGAFRFVEDYCIKNLDNFKDCKNFVIIKGISETNEIKIESLDENLKSYSEEADALIKVEKTEFDIGYQTLLDEINNIFSNYIVGLIINFEVNHSAIEKIIENSLLDFDKNSEIISEFDKIYKNFAIKLAKVRKKNFQFKKEVLLFELSTFEEIISYSVSRLKLENSEKETAFVALIEKANEIIKSILKQNGINIIAPLKHEVFNVKEHEILIAEENPEYKKGEIIKVLNSGYKQLDTVIIRANVIACK